MIRISDVRRVGSAKREANAAASEDVPAEPKQTQKKETPLKDAAFADGSPAARLLDTLLEDAVAVGASAVHVEPHGDGVLVRYRVDGLLRRGKTISRSGLKTFTARVKQLANLDVGEFRLPQDGRFEADTAKKYHFIRAAVVPVAGGEKVVLHIVDQSATPHDLEQLGYWGHSLYALQDAATQAHGLVIVSGPAGSGKTSTLYGLLQVVANPSLNIATIEETIERHLEGINQTPVNIKAGMTYTGALRAVLHQDPNILMISELREPQTTALAMQAALAGRLIFAGMHTHDVASTLSHLVAMNTEPYLLASTVKAVANQRLVRRLCTSCRRSYKPVAGEFESACTACGLHPVGAIDHLVKLGKLAAAANGRELEEKTVSGGKITKLWRANPEGCEACGNTGYKGRVAISEVLIMSPAIQKLVFSTSPAITVYDQAISEGMVPLPMDGFVKALLGETSIEEVLRVVAQ